MLEDNLTILVSVILGSFLSIITNIIYKWYDSKIDYQKIRNRLVHELDRTIFQLALLALSLMGAKEDIIKTKSSCPDGIKINIKRYIDRITFISTYYDNIPLVAGYNLELSNNMDYIFTLFDNLILNLKKIASENLIIEIDKDNLLSIDILINQIKDLISEMEKGK